MIAKRNIHVKKIRDREGAPPTGGVMHESRERKGKTQGVRSIGHGVKADSGKPGGARSREFKTPKNDNTKEVYAEGERGGPFLLRRFFCRVSRTQNIFRGTCELS